MLPYVIFGAGYGFAAGIQPGPLQAFLVSRVAAVGWRRTLPACVAPLLSDGPIAALVLLVVGQLPSSFQDILRTAGGALLVYLAWGTLRQVRHPASEEEGMPSAPRTLTQAVLVNVLNPNPYIGWALVLGPSVVAAWNERPLHAVGLIVSFYGVIVAMLALTILLVGSARALGPRVQRGLLAVSAVVLAGLGVYLVVAGLYHLAASAA